MITKIRSDSYNVNVFGESNVSSITGGKSSRVKFFLVFY